MGIVYVSKNGKISIAVGNQPKDAILFSPSTKTVSQILKERREK